MTGVRTGALPIPVETDKYFVVSINIPGGCYGSTGPSSTAPDGKPWGSRFPLVTLRDTTEAEARLADALGVRSWYAVPGGSLGGARALEWAGTSIGRAWWRGGVGGAGPPVGW